MDTGVQPQRKEKQRVNNVTTQILKEPYKEGGGGRNNAAQTSEDRK
jgi:hypothetical protein